MFAPMNDGAGQAEPGWYDDPHAPGRMRYYDGEVWTNHFHTKGVLPDVGSWLNSTFAVLREHWFAAALIAFVTSVVGSGVVWFSIRALTGGLVVTDEELQNFSTGKMFGILGLVVFAWVWQGMGWLTLNRYLQRAHFDANPTISEALGRMLQRLPAFIRHSAILLAIAFLGFLAIAIVGAAVPVLLPIVLFGLLMFVVFAWIKLAFFTIAVVAAPDGGNALRESFAISQGRFFGVFGRLLFVVVVLWLIGTVVTAVTGGAGSMVDQTLMQEVFVFEEAELVVKDFRPQDLIASGGGFVSAWIISAVLSTITGIVSASAHVRLYLDAGAPSDL